MDRLLRRLLLLGACSALLAAVLNAFSLHASETPVLTARSMWALSAASAFLAVAARRFSRNACFRIVLLAAVCVLVEAALQTIGWLGLLPGVATKEKCAYGRVYWANEGRGNSLRNRDGWHFPAFDYRAAHRVAAIGDSFVEAVEVGRDRNHAALLDTRLRQAQPGWAVFGLGSHGTSPAFHREVIDYAARHFRPEQVILYVYLGNDLGEMTPESSGLPEGAYIYYQWQPDGRLAFDAASATNAKQFNAQLEFSHRSLLLQVPTILRSHCMTIQAINSVRDTLLRARRQKAAQGKDQIAHDASALGNNIEVFAVPPSGQGAACLKLLQAELDLCAQTCAAHGIELRLVTIPFFPAAFYEQPAHSAWTSQLGRYDFLAPEAELEKLARARGWPFLGLGARMRQDGLTTDAIRTFYFFDGRGHFTEAGHRYCADAVFAAFFAASR